MSDVPMKFLETMYSKCRDCSIGITTLSPSRTTWFSCDDLSSLKDHAQRTGSRTDTYIGVFPRKGGLSQSTRGDEKDVTHVCCVFADIDIRGGAHRESDLPGSIGEALSAIHEESKLPTFVFSTGHGLHAYWVFSEPFEIRSDADRTRAKAVVAGFVDHLSEIFASHGWKLDNVGDLARMLRFPLTTNFKKGGRVQGALVEHNDVLYAIGDFMPYAREHAETEDLRREVEETPVGSASRMIERCAFLRGMAENPADVSEHDWFMGLSNIALASDGNEKCHEISEGYPGYSFEETQRKYENALKSKKPCTCSYIRRSGGCCPDHGCGVKAPVVFSLLDDAERIEALMQRKDLGVREAFSEGNLALAARIRDGNPGLYVEYKSHLRSLGIGVREFEKNVRKHASKAKVRSTAEEDFADSMPLVVKERVFGSLHAPEGYSITSNGVFLIKGDDAGGTTEVRICSEPAIVTGIVENVDTEAMGLELTYVYMNRWRKGVYPRSTILSRSNILRIADRGLPVSSENSDEFVRYIAAFEAANRDGLPVGRGVSRAGWIGKTEFYPYLLETPVVYEGEDQFFIQALSESGDRDRWLSVMEELRSMPFSRIQLAAAYASPLVSVLQVRIPILHVWHDSKSGKSACLKAAASIYGRPEKLVFNFNSTSVGFERKAGMYGNIPLLIDELQQLGRNVSLSTIVYQIGNGQGRTRGGKAGGLQETSVWKLSSITNGEQPILSDSSMDGVGSRVIQLYAKSIEDRRLAQHVHQVVESNYGFGARPYIGFLVENRDAIRGDFEDLREALDEASDKDGFEDAGPHLDGIALFCLGDLYSSMSIFGMEREKAWIEAVALGREVLRSVNATIQGDSVEMAWHHIEGWIAENRMHFSENAEDCYGVIEAGRVYAIGTTVKKSLEAAGFNYSKCMRGFKDKGWIDYETTSDGKVRCLVQKKIRGVNCRVMCAFITISQKDDPEEDFL